MVLVIDNIDKNDPLCEFCDYRDKDYCSDGVNMMPKEIVAKRDIDIAKTFKILIGDKLRVTELIEKLIDPSFMYCLGINCDDFFRIKY